MSLHKHALKLAGVVIALSIIFTGCSALDAGKGSIGGLKPTPHWQTVWTTNNNGSNYVFITDMAIASPNNGWISVDSSSTNDMYTLHTPDAGKTWKTQQDPTGQMSWTSSNSGWLFGYGNTGVSYEPEGTWRTSDGGVTWQITSRPARFETFTMLTALSSLEAWGVTADKTPNHGPRLVHTADGGKTWQEIRNPGFPQMVINSFAFADKLHGWISLATTEFVPGQNQGVILHTSDGWKTFQSFKIPPSKFANTVPEHIAWSSPNDAWGQPTEGDVLLHTNDGGKTWNFVVPKPAAKLSGQMVLHNIAVVSPKEIWAVGRDDEDALVIVSRDAGKTWDRVMTGAEAIEPVSELRHISAIDPNHIWIGGEGGIHGSDMPPTTEKKMSFVLQYVP
jgi:photosystem II stability/assembly factor-like uncharacterized protein